MGYRYVWQGGGEGATVTLVEDPDYDSTGNPLPKSADPALPPPVDVSALGGQVTATPLVASGAIPAVNLSTGVDIPSLLNLEAPSIQNAAGAATTGVNASAFDEIAQSLQDQTKAAMAQLQDLTSAANVSAPTVLTPNVMPTLGDQAAQDARRTAISEMLARNGRASTILTTDRMGA